MDFNILYAIQGIRFDFLDQIVLLITMLNGSLGQLWVIVGVGLCIFKQTRKCGAAILLAYVVGVLVGHVILKEIIARPRPCQIDSSVALLVDKPSSFSCPSTHTLFAFSSATVIFQYYKKVGIAAFIFAAIVGFTRMYLFVHFPTDVLFGAVLGVACGVIAVKSVDALSKKWRFLS